MKITVKIKRSHFDSALLEQGDLLEGSVTLGDICFSYGWVGLVFNSQRDWWEEAVSLFSSARKALEVFEAENLEHGCFYTHAVLTWDGAQRRWLLDARGAVRWCSGGNGYGTSIAV